MSSTLSFYVHYFHDKIIIIGVLGTVVYYLSGVFSCIFALHNYEENYIIFYDQEQTFYLMIKGLVKMTELYMQVICILQMNNFKKVDRTGSGIHYLFFCLAIINLLYWIEDSIFEAPMDDQNILEILYDSFTGRVVSKFVYPIVIFFRFKSFIAFWDIYFSDPQEI